MYKLATCFVFWSHHGLPIIHRVVDTSDGYTTKGDHNAQSFGPPLGEINIEQERVIGKAVARVLLPWLHQNCGDRHTGSYWRLSTILIFIVLPNNHPEDITNVL